MKRNVRKYYVSRFLAGLFTVSYAVTLIFPEIANLLKLSPGELYKGFDLWRIVTFPLVGVGAASFVLLFLTFYFIGPKEEDLSRKTLLPMTLITISIIQGALTTFIFSGTNLTMAGADGLCFFLLTIFTLKNRKRRLLIFGLRAVKTPVFTGAIAGAYLLIAYAERLTHTNEPALVASGVSLVYGILSAFPLYWKHLYQKRADARAKDTLPSYSDIPSPEELSLAMIVQSELKKYKNSLNDDLKNLDYDAEMPTDEDLLNQILDKMNEKGRDSLTPAERKFLHDYSGR